MSSDKPIVPPSAGVSSGSGKRSGLSPKTKAALVTVALTAAERLSDPEVRAKVAEQSRNLAKQVAEWRAQRNGTGGDGSQRSRAVRGLEQRADRLRASVATLAMDRPDRADAVYEAHEVLDELDVAIGVADGLPKATRKEAIARVDGELDRVERLVFEASLPSPRRP